MLTQVEWIPSKENNPGVLKTHVYLIPRQAGVWLMWELPALERGGRRPGLSLGYPAWGLFQKPRWVPAAGADSALLSYREGSPERASAL